MKKQTLLFVLVLLMACSTKPKSLDQQIESSKLFYNQFDLKKSRQLLEAALAKETEQNQQKCEVLLRLAHQDWKYYQEYELAKNRLKKANTFCTSMYSNWMLLNRIERESNHFVEALSAARKAKDFAASEDELNNANIEYAHSIYAYSSHRIAHGIDIDSSLVNQASELLSQVLETDAGMPLPSKLLLGISLLNNDGKNAIKAWLSYFQFQDINHVNPYLKDSSEKLSQVSENWNGKKLRISDQEKLIDALASSRFYEFIPVYIKNNNHESAYDQKTRDIITYSKYLEVIHRKTNEYYRLIAIEQENETAYIEWLNNTRKMLWNSLSLTAKKTYNESTFLNLTQKHFGARGFTGSTGNYSGFVLSLGHIVNQEKATVNQFGFQPEFTYTEIDMMTSNGYSSWFWEDKSIGGWATDNEIVRIREAYLNGPFAAWKSLTDPQQKLKKLKTINTFLNTTTGEESKILEGLVTKLRFDAISDLYEELVSDGLVGQELKLAFLSKYQQSRVDASLLAHEGRHSIEQKYMPEEFAKWDNEKREFHAKLSQIIFASDPRLELAEMLNNVSGDSGHAKANKRIIKVASTCVKKQKREGNTIYSDKKSNISQVYLMTKKQIMECFKQVDPLYKKFLGQA